MVTNLQENLRKKCERYWPDISSEQYGPFRVTLRDTLVYANYVIRELHMEVSVRACTPPDTPHQLICSVWMGRRRESPGRSHTVTSQPGQTMGCLSMQDQCSASSRR